MNVRNDRNLQLQFLFGTRRQITALAATPPSTTTTADPDSNTRVRQQSVATPYAPDV